MPKTMVAQFVALLHVLLLPLDKTAAQIPNSSQEHLAAVEQPAGLEYKTQFQTDNRTDFQITGAVDWQSGQLTLLPDAVVNKPVHGNWKANWQFDLFVAPTAKSSSVQLRWQVTLADGWTPWRITWQQTSPTTWQLTLADLQNPFGFLTKATTIRQSGYQKPIDGRWHIEYNAGLVQVWHEGNRILAGYIDNATAAVVAGQWRVAGTKLHLRSWQQLSTASVPLTEPQQQALTKADELTQAGFQAYNQGKYAAAEPLLASALTLREQHLGKKHPLIAQTLNLLALSYQSQMKSSEAEPLYRRALEITEQGLDKSHPGTATALNNLAELYRALGKYTEAEPLYERALSITEQILGEKHPDTATALNNVALLLIAQGKYTEAEPLLKRSLALNEQQFGKNHPAFATALINLAWLYYSQGKYLQAEPLNRQALTIREQRLGPDHLETALAMNNLALLYQTLGKYTEAEPLLRRALSIREQRLGPDHPAVLTSLFNLAWLYYSQGKYTEAEPIFHCAVVMMEQQHHQGHPVSTSALNNFAELYRNQGKYAEAERYLRQALAITEQSLGHNHPDTTTSLNNLAGLYYIQKKYTEASSLFNRALAVFEQTLGKDHPTTATLLNNIAELYRLQGKYAEAEPLYRRALAINEQQLGPNHTETARIWNNLGLWYQAQKKFLESEACFRRALTIHEQILGKENPETGNLRNNLACLYLAQNNFAAAEPLFIGAIEIAERNWFRLNDDRFARSQQQDQFVSHQNLAQLYLLTNRPIEAWQTWERSLGRGLLDELQARQQQRLSPLQKQQWQLLHAMRQSYAKLLEDAANKPGISQAQREEWQQHYRRYAADLAQHQHDCMWQQQELAGQVANLARIQSYLLPQQAIIGWLDDQLHYGFVVRSAGAPLWVELPGQGAHGRLSSVDLQLPIQILSQLSTRTETNLSASSRQQLDQFLEHLRQQRLEPLQPALAAQDGLPAATHWIVLPSNGMAGIPIETLADGHQRVSYVASGTVFAWLREQRLKRADRDQSAGLLAIGDPVFAVPPPPTGVQEGPKWGVVIEQVNDGGNAAKAGIQANDVIVRYHTTDIFQFSDLAVALQSAQQQGLTEVTIRLWRHDRERNQNDKTIGEQIVTVPTGPLGVRIRPEPVTDAAQVVAQRAAANWQASLKPFEPLPGTRREVLQLQRLALQHNLPATILLGSGASEQALYQLNQTGNLSKFRCLHFATHAIANEQNPLQSKLILARDQLPDPVGQLQTGAPVFRGELTAEKILHQWDLNADLAVLSACQTGLGQFIKTEGYVGLSQPFLLAGAQSVVVSLWSVDDTATQLLMNRFYANLWGQRAGLSEPMNKVEALHEAKQWLRTLTVASARQVLQQQNLGLEVPLRESEPEATPYSHPHFWAAFILIGDWQ